MKLYVLIYDFLKLRSPGYYNTVFYIYDKVMTNSE